MLQKNTVHDKFLQKNDGIRADEERFHLSLFLAQTFFNFRFQLQKRISFPNENDFHFAFHFQNQIHLEKVLAASENL